MEYNVSKAIAEVKRLRIQLIRISRQRRWKHPVRVKLLDKLLRRYKNELGKPIVHLSNLPEGVSLALNEQGLDFLESPGIRLKRNFGRLLMLETRN